MPRAFWKGVISFGLVAIPVKMYVGTESKTLSFHLLHKKCLTRPKQVLHCETDNEYFSIKDTVRGYEVAKEQYVVLDDSDFEKVPIKTSHAIDILGFVEAKEIDPIYYYGSPLSRAGGAWRQAFPASKGSTGENRTCRHCQSYFSTARTSRLLETSSKIFSYCIPCITTLRFCPGRNSLLRKPKSPTPNLIWPFLWSKRWQRALIRRTTKTNTRKP